MDAIELAAVPESTPLVAALVTMRARGQSGLVSVAGDGVLRLITPRDVVVALHGNLETLAEIRDARLVTADLVPLESAKIGRSRNWIVSAVNGGALRERGRNVMDVHEDRAQLETHFNAGHDYTVALLDVGRAVVVTRSEVFTEILGRAVPNYVCSCSNAFHDFDVKPPTCTEHGCKVLRRRFADAERAARLPHRETRREHVRRHIDADDQ
jgi:hypothetical protein